MPRSLYTIISTDKQGVVSDGAEVEFVKRGLMYTIDTLIDISAGAAYYILLDSTSKTTGNVISYPFELITTDGPVYVTLSVGHDYTGGTPVVPFNRNANSSNTAQTVVSLSPTGTTTGTAIAEYIVGTSATPLFSGGGGQETGLPYIVRTPSLGTQLLKIDNQSGSSIKFEFRLNFAEY
jgi:hypothetical protein